MSSSSKFAAMTLPVDKPARMTIVHPITRNPMRDAEGKEAYVDVYSADSEVARKHQRTTQRRRLNVAQRGGRAKISVEEIEADATDFLAVLSAGWYLLALDGAVIDVPFSIENARELYAAGGMSWLREQVDEFAADRGNFSQASSTN